MANSPDTAVTQELFKTVYDTDVINAPPQYAIIQKGVKFKNEQKTGSSFNFAVLVQNPQGHTWTGGADLGTVVTLKDAVNGVTKQASVTACEYVIREQLAYGLISGSATPEAAFKPAANLLVGAVVNSASWALELTCMHGGGNIGEIDTITNGSGTTAVLLLTEASWAPGNFSAFEGGLFDVYTANLVTKRNTDGPVKLDSVDIDACSLNVTFASAGDRTAADPADVLVPVGANGNWQYGIMPSLKRAADGSSLYGITTGDYGLLRAGTYSNSGGPLTFAALAAAQTKAVAKGGMVDQVALVSPWAWTDINNDEAGNRRYVEDNGGEFVNGAEKLTYYGPGGKLDVMQHGMMKAGEAALLNFEDWIRIGASEPTFNIPGRGSLENPMMLIDRQDQNAVEFRRYWCQSIACQRMARQVIITDIVNSSGPL
jgi:hypothetical protein